MRVARWPRPSPWILLVLAGMAAAALGVRSSSSGGRAVVPAPAAAATPAVAPPTAPPADPLRVAVEAFASDHYGDVVHAMRVFAADPDAAIPHLIALLDRDERVELNGTADLIYPGADRFYGHGGMVVEDLDWISARAVWALGELTFQSFWRDPMRWPGSPEAQAQLDADRRRAIARVRAWWQVGVGVTRRAALLEALDSHDPRRRASALEWLGFDARDEPIPGVEPGDLRRALLPRLRRLSRAGQPDERETARWILDEPPWSPRHR